MNIHIEHTIAKPLEVVEPLLLEPVYFTSLCTALSTVESGSIIHSQQEGNIVERKAKFLLSNKVIPGFWIELVGRPGWVEVVRWDKLAHCGTFVITPMIPDHLVRRTTCTGTYTLTSVSPTETKRVIDCELIIRVPVVGKLVESQLQGILSVQFTDESRWFNQQKL